MGSLVEPGLFDMDYAYALYERELPNMPLSFFPDWLHFKVMYPNVPIALFYQLHPGYEQQVAEILNVQQRAEMLSRHMRNAGALRRAIDEILNRESTPPRTQSPSTTPPPLPPPPPTEATPSMFLGKRRHSVRW